VETRANYVTVGVFTLVALLLAFGFVYWSARFGDRSETVSVTIRIPGSAAGLGRGSAILFNGIRVGEVRAVFLDADNPTVAIAEGLIDMRSPLKPSTRAALGIQGLTGQAYIEFKGGSPEEPNLIGATDGPIEIDADPSFLNDVVDAARTLVNRAGAVLSTFEKTIADISGPVTATARNAETFSAALAARSGDIDEFLASTGELAKTLGGASERLQVTLGKVDAVIDAVDPETVRKTLENAEIISSRLADGSKGLEELIASLQKAGENANATIARIDELVRAVPPGDVSTIVADIKGASGQAATVMADASAAAKAASELVERLNAQSDDVTAIVGNARQLTERLNAASVRVDGVLQKVDALLGGGDTGGAFAELQGTLRAYRTLADSLNARIPAITAGLERFTGSGLRDIQQAVGAAQGSIERIERAITDLSANPQRIISGGGGEVRTFDGRNRR
jgi:phospholipid/cholesterol/gamma-HCH transport system substrate-binding protein